MRATNPELVTPRLAKNRAVGANPLSFGFRHNRMSCNF
jgi:LDH2 family malate/lactate/ureidoglycolate dehydrogenase